MKNLILVGAGDWGLEVHSWIHESIQFGVEYVFKGFIDDNIEAINNLNILKSSKEALNSTMAFLDKQ